MINLEEYRTVDSDVEGKMPETGIKDVSYVGYFGSKNGGYYFTNTIHFFGESKTKEFHDIHYMNRVFRQEYSVFSINDIAIGEDVFGSLFLFGEKGYYHFNIESGEKEFLAKDFDGLIVEIVNDLDFFTGGKLLDFLVDGDQEKLANGFRMSGRKPFIIGGEYDKNNIVLKPSIENLKFSASIARQIKDLPDGQPVNIILK